MTQELYKKYRPVSFDRVNGQEAAIKVLSTFVEKNTIPHAILFTGPSGCGKTTLARILTKHLECGISDFQELNCADLTGIDEVRKIRQRMGYACMGGKSRVWIIDEAHKLSNAAQNAFLKMLEDTPKHVYFIFCTTEPNKIITTIKTRCTPIHLKALTPNDIRKSISYVSRKENIDISKEVVNKIIEVSEGSARHAIVILDQIIGLTNEDEQLANIVPPKAQAEAIEVFKTLMYGHPTWSKMAVILKALEEEPEGIRRLVLACARNTLLSDKNTQKAAIIIEEFRDNYFDCGAAGLAASCYAVINGR